MVQYSTSCNLIESRNFHNSHKNNAHNQQQVAWQNNQHALLATGAYWAALLPSALISARNANATSTQYVEPKLLLCLVSD
jgi:hypothetical protein